MLSKWLNSQKKYRIRRISAFFFYIIALSICIVCYIYVSIQSNDVRQNSALSSSAIGLMVGIIFGSIPLAIGQVINNKSKKEYGRPYCRMTHEFLYTDDKGVQFGYHNTESNYTASMDVYHILYRNINRVNFDETYNIVTIIGCGELTAYDDYSTKQINEELSGRKFYEDSCYSFVLAFEGQKEFLNLIKSKSNWED